MKVNVSIERVFIDGIALSEEQQGELRSALTHELARLVRNGTGLADGSLANRTSQSAAFVQGAPVEVNQQVDPTDLGQQIARSVLGGIYR
jgi:hypothetical protein